MHMKTIKWGIIGVGDVCEVKSGPGFQKATNSELVAVMRRDAEKAKDYANRHGVPKWSTDAEELIHAAEVDAIYVATPPAQHLEYTRRALAAGKHVYVEKPMALNAGEASEICELERVSRGKVCVAHYRRQLPLYQRIESILRGGELGSPRLVSIKLIKTAPQHHEASSKNWRLQPSLSGGGLFHDLAPHQIDLLLKYFGEPSRFEGFSLRRAANRKCDDCVIGQMQFDGNVAFQGYWDFASQVNGDSESCRIECDRGAIQFGFFESSTFTVETERGTETHSEEPPAHIAQPLIEEVNRYFLGEANNPCSANVGWKVMEIMDAFTRPFKEPL